MQGRHYGPARSRRLLVGGGLRDVLFTAAACPGLRLSRRHVGQRRETTANETLMKIAGTNVLRQRFEVLLFASGCVVRLP